MTKTTRYFVSGAAAVLVTGLCTGLVAYYGGIPTGAFNAATGPADLAYLPADSAVVAHANVSDVMGSDLRQKLRAVMPEGPESQGQAEFKEQTGIDIEQDIEAVTSAVVSGEQAGPHKMGGLLVLRGRFDAGRLEALARGKGTDAENYKGARLVTMTRKADADAEGDAAQPGDHVSFTGAAAFAEPGVIILGNVEQVRAAIDRKASGQNLTTNADMMNRISAVDNGANAWAVGRFDAIAAQAKLPEQVAAQIPPVAWFSAAGHINGGVTATLRAEARDDEAAKNLRDVLNGFMALAKLQAGSNPEIQAIAQSLALGGSGKNVEVSFTLPSELFDLLIAKHQAEKNKAL